MSARRASRSSLFDKISLIAPKSAWKESGRAPCRSHRGRRHGGRALARPDQRDLANESPREQLGTSTTCSCRPLRFCHCVTLTVPSVIM